MSNSVRSAASVQRGVRGERGRMERRFYPMELRVEGGGQAGEGEERKRIVGYAAVFDSLSVELWGFRERIARGAFAAAIAEGDDVRALWNHNTAYVLGRTKNGTLVLEEDERGLRVEIEPPGTGFAADFLVSLERGDVDQMSFGFYPLEAEWDMDEEGELIRTLKKVKLFEVSPVTFPAYPATEVSVREAGAVDPVYGYVPEAPDALQGQTRCKGAAHGCSAGRVAMLRRRLALAGV